MQRVDKITNGIKQHNPYPKSMKNELIQRFGCDGENGNFTICGEYSHALISTIGKYISKHNGELSEYQMWYCDAIKSWRLVFGFS